MNFFVDTSAFYAALSRTDVYYERALLDWNRLLDDPSVTFCTSNYVVVETCALVRNRLGDDAMRRFLNDLLPLAMVIWVDHQTHAAATVAMLAHGSNGPSLTDCCSFAIMREAHMSDALAYDKHFVAQGFSS